MKTIQPRMIKMPNSEWTERQIWYRSKKWKRLRYKFLHQYPQCCRCGAKSTVVDHINGHGMLDWRERFWTGPFQPMCKSCHSTKTLKEERYQQRTPHTRLRNMPWRR